MSLIKNYQNTVDYSEISTVFPQLSMSAAENDKNIMLVPEFSKVLTTLSRVYETLPTMPFPLYRLTPRCVVIPHRVIESENTRLLLDAGGARYVAG